jgi:hypothetical protein
MGVKDAQTSRSSACRSIHTSGPGWTPSCQTRRVLLVELAPEGGEGGAQAGSRAGVEHIWPEHPGHARPGM